MSGKYKLKINFCCIFAGYLGLICVLVCNHVFPVPTHVFIFGYQIWKLARSLELYRTLFYENLAQFEMVKLQQV